MPSAFENDHRSPGGRVLLAAGRPIALLVFLLALMASPAIAADGIGSDAEVSAVKTFWQNRYRTLISKAARLRAEISQERERYADANRRNYRRGKKRHVHRVAVEKATRTLATVEAELATIQDEGRRAGALPGWFYEVEIEMEESAQRPSVTSGPADDGRNPLYTQEKP